MKTLYPMIYVPDHILKRANFDLQAHIRYGPFANIQELRESFPSMDLALVKNREYVYVVPPPVYWKLKKRLEQEK